MRIQRNPARIRVSWCVASVIHVYRGKVQSKGRQVEVSNSGPVHIVITRIAKPGMEAEVEVALRSFVCDFSRSAEGTRAHLVLPGGDGNSREFGILRTFDNQQACEAFYASDLYLRWDEQIAPLVIGSATQRRLHGFEAFFRDAPQTPPPRWKMAFITWIGVCIAVFIWSSTLPRFLTGLHPLLVMAIVNGVVVATLAWLLMPLLTALFAGWLRKAKAAANSRRSA